MWPGSLQPHAYKITWPIRAGCSWLTRLVLRKIWHLHCPRTELSLTRRIPMMRRKTSMRTGNMMTAKPTWRRRSSNSRGTNLQDLNDPIIQLHLTCYIYASMFNHLHKWHLLNPHKAYPETERVLYKGKSVKNGTFLPFRGNSFLFDWYHW